MCTYLFKFAFDLFTFSFQHAIELIHTQKKCVDIQESPDNVLLLLSQLTRRIWSHHSRWPLVYFAQARSRANTLAQARKIDKKERKKKKQQKNYLRRHKTAMNIQRAVIQRQCLLVACNPAVCVAKCKQTNIWACTNNCTKLTLPLVRSVPKFNSLSRERYSRRDDLF